MTVPFTIDGSDIPVDAPKSELSDAQAAQIQAASADYRAIVMHLHADVTGRDVTLTGANCAPGLVLFNFGDGSTEVEQRIADGDTPTATHTYPSDGVFLSTLRHETGDRAQLEVAINFPPEGT
jgi:hypothetical protein